MSYRKKQKALSPGKVVLIVGSVVIAGAIALWMKSPYLRSALDRTAPEISLDETPSAPSGGNTFTVTARDPQGIRTVEVSFVQGEKRKELAMQPRSGDPVSADAWTGAVIIPGAAEGFADGKGVLEVKATDSGMWSNAAALSRELLIDTRPPKIELLSLQHVVAQGGSELVLVRARDENLTAVGATVGGVTFPAFKLADADPFFATLPEYYGVLMALPLEFKTDRDKVELFASDAAGNTRTIPVSFRIAGARLADVGPKLTEQFLRTTLPDLLASYARMTKEAVPSETEIDSAGRESLIGSFKLINEGYRGVLATRLKELLEGKIAPKRWSGDFIKPMSAATTSIFGERRSYHLDGEDAGSSIHYGLDLASVTNDAVRASNAGAVLFAGEFGIYGETVVIDHGLGLSSLYGHLSSTSVGVGDAVQAGTEIGRSGKTGLAGGDHLHFEYRINNIPVTPIEWWDPKWVRDHFDGKIEGLKVSLQAAAGGASAR